jgi:two-component system cell cycle sensor histidine kinase/response regulator CckA
MALVSTAWCAGVAYLEVHGLLPRPLGPYSPTNSWAAVTITVLFTSVLLVTSIESLRRVHAEAEKAANERDEALRRSIQGQKMELVGNLTSGIAHDLNNLLTVIVGSASMLRERAMPEDRETHQVLDDLDTASSRAALMTSQLLAFGRPRGTENAPVNLSAVLDDMTKMLPRLLGSAISVVVKVAPDCWCLASRVGLEQILLNLAVNARDAMAGAGTLSLELSVAGERVVLTATDTGAGMSAEAQARAFEPFFTTKASGTGLGLATVRELALRYGAAIELDSELGRGTTFVLSFPRIPTPSPSKRPAPRGTRPLLPDEPSASRGRVLLVEDDALVRRTLTRTLTREGYDVVATANGDEALAIAGAARGLTCVVSDLSMPGMDGETLARALRSSHPALPMVLISGNRAPDPELIADLPRTFLPKPVTDETLLAAIREVTAPPSPPPG